MSNYYDIFAVSMRKFLLLAFLFFLISPFAWAQTDEVREDLRDHWKISRGGRLEDYNGQPAQAIHFFIEDQFRGGTLFVKSPAEFTIFVNGKLQVRTTHHKKLNIDSLLAKSSGTPLLSIFQNSNIKSAQTQLISNGNTERENPLRQTTHFADFVILSSMLLFGLFVVLFRSNTRLTIDYLNLAKVFSFQEREEAIVTGRIGSSVNLLFFVFISLLFGLLLILIFHWGPVEIRFSSIGHPELTSDVFVRWGVVSSVVLALLIGKLLLIWCLSKLFGFKDVVRFQFFNFIRSLYVASALMGIASLVYFMIGVYDPGFFFSLLVSVCGFMILGAVFLYFKLMTRASSAGFHLFSYLCGSEIIPLMILIKVLLY